MDVAGMLLIYRNNPDLRVIPPDARWEVPLEVSVGGLSIYARADALWCNHTVHITEIKTSLPHQDTLCLQLTCLHAGARRAYPSVEIRHLLLTFRPEPVLREIPLDVGTYRSTIRLIADTARAIAAERDWPARPGDACRRCEYAECCDAAAAQIEQLAY